MSISLTPIFDEHSSVKNNATSARRRESNRIVLQSSSVPKFSFVTRLSKTLERDIGCESLRMYYADNPRTVILVTVQGSTNRVTSSDSLRLFRLDDKIWL